MTTTATEASTTAAAEAAEAAADAADAAAATAATEAATDETPPPDAAGGDTVVVVADDTPDEGAQDDATALDHEQRITRLEERLGGVETIAQDAAMRADVAEMIAGHSHDDVIEQAAAVAEATVEATVEAGETGEPATVRVDEPPPSSGGDGIADVVTVTPDVPPAAERRRNGLLRW